MNGFVATPAPPHSPAGAVVAADGWFPEISVNAMRDAMRLRGDVPHARLVAAIEGAIVTVLNDTAAWRATRTEDSLSEIDAPTIAGRSRLALLWERAVRFYAAAELADLARDASATDDAARRLEEEQTVAADMRRHALSAVRDLIGTSRIDVELI
jgi:hypothetical protein